MSSAWVRTSSREGVSLVQRAFGPLYTHLVWLKSGIWRLNKESSSMADGLIVSIAIRNKEPLRVQYSFELLACPYHLNVLL
jgi:hypothetical protein